MVDCLAEPLRNAQGIRTSLTMYVPSMLQQAKGGNSKSNEDLVSDIEELQFYLRNAFHELEMREGELMKAARFMLIDLLGELESY
jgi:hypothetical protein